MIRHPGEHVEEGEEASKGSWSAAGAVGTTATLQCPGRGL